MPHVPNRLRKGFRHILLRSWVFILGLMILGTAPASAQIGVDLPDTTGVAGNTGTIPVEVDDLTGKGVLSFEFTVSYNADTLSVVGVETSGTLASELNVVANTDSVGEVSVSAGGTQTLAGSGALVKLKVRYEGAGTSPLNWNNFQFNEGSPAVALSRGTVTVQKPPPGDITVRLPEVEGEVGDSTTVPITVSDTDGPNGEGVLSFDFTFSYDSNLITIDTVTSAGTLTETWTIESNTSESGKVSVSAGNTETLKGQDSVLVKLDLSFEAKGTSSLEWQQFQFNEGDPTAELVDGTATVSTDGTLPPDAPTGLSADVRDGEIHLTWEENTESDLVGYNVYRSTDTFSDVSGLTPINGNTVVQNTSYTDQDVSRGKRYYYRLTAVDSGGNESEPSDQIEAELTFGWPTPSDTPSLVFKVETSSSSSVARVILTRESGDRTGNILSEKTIEGNFVVFDRTDLRELNVDGRSTARINLYSATGQLLGHQEFKYDSGFYTRKKSIDAILYVHGENILQPNLDQSPDLSSDWDYYTEGEHPVSMLIPPSRQIENVGGSSPLLMVHGISGIYPYWGFDPFQPNPNGDPSLVSELSDQYDTWRFYYPKNQDVTKSSPLLSKALRTIQQDYYETGEKIDVVAHSMGGLVTRHYIQSDSEDGGIGPDRKTYPDSLRYSQNQNIGKLIMLGTPNHGARSAYLAAHGLVEGGFSALTGKDPEAPAYRQLTPGSEFLWDLNSIENSSFYSKKKTLILAGTLNPLNFDPTGTLFEIYNQGDGLVSVSSASLLNEGIPLATGRFTHSSSLDRDDKELIGEYDSRLPTDTAPIVTSFLNSRYNPKNPSFGNLVTGFWESKDNVLVGPPDINRDEGILVLEMPGVNVDGFSVSKCKNTYKNCKPNELYFEKRGRSMRKVPSRTRYFSSGLRGSSTILPSSEFVKPGIGISVSEGEHPVRLRKVVPGSGTKTFGRFRFYFEHLQTTRKSVRLSETQKRIANAEGFIPASGSSSPKLASGIGRSNTGTLSKATGEVKESQFLVTSSTDTLAFWLARDSTGSFSGHNMRLLTPDGTVIDSTDAKSRSGFGFTQNLEAGFALYSVADPAAGKWRVRHNTSVPSTVATPVMSGINLSVSTPDSSFTTGEEIPVTVSFSGQGIYEKVDLSGVLSVQTQGDSTRTVNMGALSLSTSTATTYEGSFTPSYRGTYRVTLDFSARIDGASVLRRAVETVTVTGDSAEVAPSPPSAPSNLSVQTRGTEKEKVVSLDWSASSSKSASRYHVYRDTIPDPTARIATVSSSNTAYSDSTVVAGNTYYYRVTTESSEGIESAFSNEATARPQDRTAPNAPSNFTASSSIDSIRIVWTPPKAQDILKYRVYRDKAPIDSVAGPESYTAFDSTSVGDTTFVDTSGTVGQRYHYRVTAVDEADNESSFSEEVTARPEDVVPPAVPKGLTAEAGNGQVSLTWNANTEADLAGYLLYRAVGQPPDTSEAPLTEALLPDESFTDTSVSRDRNYRYGVTAVDTAGNESPLSTAVTAYLPPEQIEASVSRVFGDASGPGDYRLVALPGAVDTSLASVVPGEAGAEWIAYRDDGTELHRYATSSSGEFTLQKGRGFWLTSRQTWTFEDSIEAASVRDSTTSVPLNDGWTIVANPFGEAVSHASLQAANKGTVGPLWPFEGAFNDTSATFASARSGRAYYLFNDNSDRDSLRVPHPALTEGTISEKALTTTASSKQDGGGPALLALSVQPGDSRTGAVSTVRVGLTEKTDPDASLRAPPGQLEPVSLRIVDRRNSGEESAERLLMRDRRQADGEGAIFPLRLTSRASGTVILRARGADSLRGRSAALLDPSAGRTYDLTVKNRIEITVEGDRRPLKVAIGSERYVENQRESVLPEEVTLTSYPNPARRQSTIEYALPEETKVTLRIYDVLGRRVATLASGKKRAGRHAVTLDATGLASGVYFGRLVAGDKQVTRKITVVR